MSFHLDEVELKRKPSLSPKEMVTDFLAAEFKLCFKWGSEGFQVGQTK